jgi:hypothetical protein
VLTDLGVGPVAAPEVAGRGTLRVFPNPMRSGGAVEFDVPRGEGRLNVSLVDVAGRRVRTLFDGTPRSAGQRVELDAAGLPAGVYFVQVSEADGQRAAKVVVTR